MAFRSVRPIHIVAAHLALVTAVVHLALGILNWAQYASAGILLPPDLRWPLFVASGLTIVVGMVALVSGYPKRPLYVGGSVLMIVYIVGYFGWHVSGHRPLLVVGTGTHHHGSTVSYLLAHVVAGPAEFLSLVSEAGLLVVLLYLLVTEETGESAR